MTQERTNKTIEKRENYEAFVEKFKAKKTTDDCYTPSYIYEAVLGWLRRNADIEGRQIVRPFWPGGDYRAADYPEGCVVVDNPPFSILAGIKRWYAAQGIRFFLFAPHLTLFSSDDPRFTNIIADASVRYENGAVVNTDFVTNLPDFARYGIMGEPSLKAAIEDAQREALRMERGKKLPKYSYPPHLVTVSTVAAIMGGGIPVRIPRKEIVFVRRIDAQIPMGKAVYGGGFLCSNRIAEKLKAEKLKAEKLKAEKLKAEKLKAEKLKAAHQFRLSEREQLLVDSL